MPRTKTALVVGDSSVARLLIRSLLPDRHHIKEAVNGEKGLACYHEKQPNLLFLDLLMPNIGDEKIFSGIKKFGPNPRVVATSNIQSAVSIDHKRGCPGHYTETIFP